MDDSELGLRRLPQCSRGYRWPTLTKWLLKLLEPVGQMTRYSLQYKFELIDFVKELSMEGRRMFYLDDIAHFVNILITKTIEFLSDFGENSGLAASFPIVNLKHPVRSHDRSSCYAHSSSYLLCIKLRTLN